VRRRLLVYGVWALVAPALIGAYALSGARGAWAATPGTQAPSQSWAFVLTAPPAGLTSAFALTSYAVGHDHARNAHEAVVAGNRLIAQVPTGYRLTRRLGLGRVAVRERDGVYFIYVRTDVFEGVRQPRRDLVECAAGPLPLRFANVAWTSGRTLAAATRPAVYRAARQATGAATNPTPHAIAGLAVDWVSRLGHGRSGRVGRSGAGPRAAGHCGARAALPAAAAAPGAVAWSGRRCRRARRGRRRRQGDLRAGLAAHRDQRRHHRRRPGRRPPAPAHQHVGGRGAVRRAGRAAWGSRVPPS